MKKKILLLCACLLFGANAFADDISYLITDLNMDNFWHKIGKQQEKVNMVTAKLLEKNKIDKRATVFIASKKINQAHTNLFYKDIVIYAGMLNIIDNDDELAFLLGHEMAHSYEAYGGIIKYTAMKFNSKTYEYKADLKAIDYMVKAGYDPISAIIFGNKTFEEPLYDWGWFATHPKGSKRLLAMYKYIYKKYPQYLTSEKTNSPYFKNVEYMFEDELKSFKHKETIRKQKQFKKEAI